MHILLLIEYWTSFLKTTGLHDCFSKETHTLQQHVRSL